MHGMMRLILLTVVIAAVMFFMTLNVQDQDDASRSVAPDKTSFVAEPYTFATEQPGEAYLAGIYLKYLQALDEHTTPEQAFAFFSRQWRTEMLGRETSAENLLGFLRLNELREDFSTHGVEYKSKTDPASGELSRYAILRVKGILVVTGDEVTSEVIFHQDNGEWKLAGEINSMMQQMMGGDAAGQPY